MIYAESEKLFSISKKFSRENNFILRAWFNFFVDFQQLFNNYLEEASSRGKVISVHNMK